MLDQHIVDAYRLLRGVLLMISDSKAVKRPVGSSIVEADGQGVRSEFMVSTQCGTGGYSLAFPSVPLR